MRLYTSPKHLPKPKEYPIISFAGYKFNRFLVKNVTLRMRTEEEEMTTRLPSISALWPTKKKVPDEVKHIPSVVGRDFLTKAKLALYFNPSKQIALLERETVKEDE